MNRDGEGYVVYANTSVNRYFKKIRNEQSYVIDPDGEIIADLCGGAIGYYERRISQRLLKEAVKSFVESNLKLTLNLSVDIPLENILLKDYDEIDRILDRAKSEIHLSLKELR